MVEGPHGPEMPLVQGQHLSVVIAGSEHHDRCVREADVEIGVPRDDVTRGRHVGLTERLEPVDAAGDFVEEVQLRRGAPLGREQVIQLGEDER